MSERNAYVTVGGSIFGPDDDIPAELAKQITNPKVTGGDSAQSTTASSGEGIPPKGGAGSGVEAWKAYAASKDVEVADDASRDDIIAALTAANVPTE